MANWFSFRCESYTFFFFVAGYFGPYSHHLSLSHIFHSLCIVKVLWLGKECWKCSIRADRRIDVIAKEIENGWIAFCYVNARLYKISISLAMSMAWKSSQCEPNKKMVNAVFTRFSFIFGVVIYFSFSLCLSLKFFRNPFPRIYHVMLLKSRQKQDTKYNRLLIFFLLHIVFIWSSYSRVNNEQIQ